MCFWEKDNMVFQTSQPVVNEEFLTDQNGAKHIISTKKTLFLNESGEPGAGWYNTRYNGPA
jgi:two-component system NtrC family sensor kinase